MKPLNFIKWLILFIIAAIIGILMGLLKVVNKSAKR